MCQNLQKDLLGHPHKLVLDSIKDEDGEMAHPAVKSFLQNFRLGLSITQSHYVGLLVLSAKERNTILISSGNI